MLVTVDHNESDKFRAIKSRSKVNAQHESTVYLEQTLKSIIIALRHLLDTYREVAKVEKQFRVEISKLNEERLITFFLAIIFTEHMVQN